MRLLALQDRAEEDDEIGDPDDGEPEIDIPLGLGIFAALGDAEQVAGRRHDDEELVAPEDEPAEIAAEEPCPRGALHDIKRGGDQRVAAEGEDDGGCVQRPHAAEVEPGLDVEIRVRQLQRHHDADEKADDTPDHRGDDAVFHHLVEIEAGVGSRLRREAHPTQHDDRAAEKHEEQHPHMGLEKVVPREGRAQEGDKGARRQCQSR